ncbi:MAG TPA: methyltransferase domain-containing protein [Candidatus Bathyarchaeia archaeon]|nr:methyltransferase domain-containing protein [Candidatus Bathyarchaeia archaeon]
MSNGKPEISRVRRTKAEAQETYDRISGWYDLLEGIWEKKSRDVGLQKLGVKAGGIVLEVGFGMGHGILALAQSVGESGMVYGIDLSPRMLNITQARVNKMNLSERVKLVRGDAVYLPFDAEFFDAIFMSFTLELFDTPEIPKVLAECKRVLRHSGRICAVSISKTGGSNWMRHLYEWGHRKFPKFLDCRPIYVQNALEDAGFQILDSTLMSLLGLPVEIVLARKLK